MSWRRIPMKFPGTCTVCGKGIAAGQMGLWAKGLGVKHEECSGPEELACAVCGGPAGCGRCEFADSCDLPNVSQLCICKKCSDMADPLGAYRKGAAAKFPALGDVIAGELGPSN